MRPRLLAGLSLSRMPQCTDAEICALGVLTSEEYSHCPTYAAVVDMAAGGPWHESPPVKPTYSALAFWIQTRGGILLQTSPYVVVRRRYAVHRQGFFLLLNSKKQQWAWPKPLLLASVTWGARSKSLIGRVTKASFTT